MVMAAQASCGYRSNLACVKCYVFVHTFLFNAHFDLEPDYIIRKAIVHRIQQCILRRKILSTFHTRLEYISHVISPIQTNTGTNAKKCQKQPLSLEGRGLPSNT